MICFNLSSCVLLSILLVLYSTHSVTSYIHLNVSSHLGIIRGSMRNVDLPDNSQSHATVYLGIPYAEPPVGYLRFRKPVKKTSLGSFFKADVEGKACPQNPFILKTWMPGPGDMSEDCLKLNVYVPGVGNSLNTSVSSNGNFKSSKKPVMIWFHGGAFLIGQSRIYNAERLAVVGDVIVVTVNYRLGPFGFLSTGDGVIPGNAGLWDQHLAITWVHENIEAFGGDPNRVTLFGESAGGASTLFQLMYEGNRGKIHRIIASSGSPLSPWGFSEESTAKYTVRLAQNLGCGFDYYPGFSAARHVKIVECLRTKRFEEIIGNSSVGNSVETLFRAEWVPILDREFIKTSPKELLLWPREMEITKRMPFSGQSDNHLLNEVDAMIGTNYDDGEAIAKITVQGFIKAVTGYDFTSKDLDMKTSYKVYVPEVINDMSGVKDFSRLKNAFEMTYGDNATVSNSTSTDVNTTKSDKELEQGRDKTIQAILDLTTDYEFLMPALRTISNLAYRSKKSSDSSFMERPKRYFYQFDRKYPFSPRPSWLHHAAHGDDLVYTFGFPGSMTEAFQITKDIEKSEWNLAKMMMTYWTNFAKSGNPGTPTTLPVKWPEFDVTRMESYLYISNNMTSSSVKSHLFPERSKLWSETLVDILISLAAADDLSKNSDLIGK